MHYKSTPYTIFTICNYIFLGFLGIICILPLVHILAVSFSGSAPANANLVTFIPIDFTFDGWEKTLGNDRFLRSLWNGVLRTVLGTFISLFCMILAAYSLSKEDSEFRGRKFYVFFFIFIMLFNGGLIPTYILIQNLGLINTIWALVLPSAINVFNMILLLYDFIIEFLPYRSSENIRRSCLYRWSRVIFGFCSVSICQFLCLRLQQLVCLQWLANGTLGLMG